jgi:hypothetical protein
MIMRHQFTNRLSFFQPQISGGFDDELHPPMFFVAIQREQAPPVCFGRSRLERMRVIAVQPRNLDPNTFNDEAVEPAFEVLPRLSALPHHRTLQPRLVNGEILRGENDEFYERIGNRIRRLRNLASGPGGEILDVAAAVKPVQPQRTSTVETQEPALDNTAQDAQPQASAPPAVTFRKLLPDPGQWCIVPFGAFKQMLAPQLAHAERLRDVHRLPCHTQVFEVTAQQHIEQLAGAIFGEGAPGRLLRLTVSAAVQLQLAPVLPPPRILGSGPRAPGMLSPGDRVFHLQVASDPTVEEAEPQNAQGNIQPSPVRTLKTSIPERFAKPWEFQCSREEALYDLSCASTFLGSLGARLRRLLRCFAFQRELRKWQILLSGKTADEQLWSVRPPHGGLTHRFVHAWAQSALELAGYDRRNMLTEWRIFWRRKGV